MIEVRLLVISIHEIAFMRKIRKPKVGGFGSRHGAFRNWPLWSLLGPWFLWIQHSHPG
jgi:hypothetical protein